MHVRLGRFLYYVVDKAVDQWKLVIRERITRKEALSKARDSGNDPRQLLLLGLLPNCGARKNFSIISKRCVMYDCMHGRLQ